MLLKSVEKIKCATRLIYVSLSDFEESIMSWKKLVISVFGEEFYEKLKNQVVFVVENPIFLVSPTLNSALDTISNFLLISNQKTSPSNACLPLSNFQ